MNVFVQPSAERYATIPGLPTVLPVWAPELVAALTEAGAEVTVGEPDRIVEEQRALELWLPVLEVASGLAIGAAGSLLANAIERFVRGRTVAPDQLHVRIHLRNGDDERVIELSGTPDDVGSALRSFDGE